VQKNTDFHAYVMVFRFCAQGVGECVCVCVCVCVRVHNRGEI
jgi:hypothetical protein